jgi:hypothetical protein
MKLAPAIVNVASGAPAGQLKLCTLFAFESTIKNQSIPRTQGDVPPVVKVVAAKLLEIFPSAEKLPPPGAGPRERDVLA